MLPYERHLKSSARTLRREMTEAEKAVWRCVRRRQIAGVQFYRQKPLGPFIADFYVPAARLVVEIDGSQHLDEAGLRRDRDRSNYLETLGLHVLRFDNRQVIVELGLVLERITAVVLERTQVRD